MTEHQRGPLRVVGEHPFNVQFRSRVPLGVMICGSLPSTSSWNRVLAEVR
jgi:hypothetical protein